MPRMGPVRALLRTAAAVVAELVRVRRQPPKSHDFGYGRINRCAAPGRVAWNSVGCRRGAYTATAPAQEPATAAAAPRVPAADSADRPAPAEAAVDHRGQAAVAVDRPAPARAAADRLAPAAVGVARRAPVEAAADRPAPAAS